MEEFCFRQRLTASQQGFDERFEFVHASRRIEAFHDVALAVDDKLRKVPADVASRALLRLQERVKPQRVAVFTTSTTLPLKSAVFTSLPSHEVSVKP